MKWLHLRRTELSIAIVCQILIATDLIPLYQIITVYIEKATDPTSLKEINKFFIQIFLCVCTLSYACLSK